MALEFKITASVDYSTYTDPNTVRLYHGTGEEMGFSLLEHGVDETQAKRFGGSGEFWATKLADDAQTFSFVTEHVGGRPVIIGFNLSVVTLDRFMNVSPFPWVWEHSQGYEFLPGGFGELNDEMTNITLTFIQ